MQRNHRADRLLAVRRRGLAVCRRTCRACALSAGVDTLLAGPDGGATPTALVPLANALKNMRRATSGMTWLPSARVWEVLRQLSSGRVEVTHEAIDGLTASRTVEHIPELLIQRGALPHRTATWRRSRRGAPPGTDIEEGRLIGAFVRWHLLPHLRSHAGDAGVGTDSFLRAKQSVTVAIQLLGWLAKRERSLADWTQGDVDAWFAGGRSTRTLSHPFVYWAIRTHRARRVEVPPFEPRSHPKVAESDRLACLRRLLLDDTLRLHLGVAGGLVLLLSQPAVRVAALRLEQMSVLDDGRARLRVADDWLDIPEPMSDLAAAHLAARPNMQTATNAQSQWVFPGCVAGRHIDPASLVTKLGSIGLPVMAAKTGTWHQLVREGPPTLLAEALGISPMTAMEHAQAASADWLRYASLVTGARPSGV